MVRYVNAGANVSISSCAFDLRMDGIDKLTLVIRLESLDFDFASVQIYQPGSLRMEIIDNIVQSLSSVFFWLSRTEKIQIGSMKKLSQGSRSNSAGVVKAKGKHRSTDQYLHSSKIRELYRERRRRWAKKG